METLRRWTHTYTGQMDICVVQVGSIMPIQSSFCSSLVIPHYSSAFGKVDICLCLVNTHCLNSLTKLEPYGLCNTVPEIICTEGGAAVLPDSISYCGESSTTGGDLFHMSREQAALVISKPTGFPLFDLQLILYSWNI